MAHDPTRSWPTGKGPYDTSIPGAAWLELLDGQAFPVVGAGAMVWNGTMWVPVSTQNRLPVDAAISGTVDVSDRADRQLGKVALSGSDVQIEVTQLINAEPLSARKAIFRDFDLQTYGELVVWVAIDRQYSLQFYPKLSSGSANIPQAVAIATNVSPPDLGRTHAYNITQYLPAHTGRLLVSNRDETQTATVSLWIGRVKRL